ncbi:DUF6988 family protein [Variovorax sp.]|uniref:DUF6988 family protein n=1 Tax=Variovorax sp. TaxID=1871043 RepID=UPI002D5D5FBD|nr:hypothetical protein [Variovorax sp.]HYP84964.1 hypothetical protein [Variovorax sp.]
MSEQGDQARLAELLVASEALDEDVGKLLGKCQPRSRRGLIAMALCGTAFEHGVSLRLLIDAGLTGTASALCRLQFEAVVRAAWTAQCANEEWLDKFTTPVEGPGHEEPASQVSIPTMLKHIRSHASHVATEFELLLGAIKAMHSFVHSGSQAVVHALMPSYPNDKLMAVIWNRNLMLLYVANAAVIAAQDPGLVPRMRLLREKHSSCMPPIQPSL